MLLKKIVIAEDDDAIAHMVNMALGDAGFLCLRARDGDEALKLVKAHDPDLLVLDVMMPRVDGLEVARRLKADVMWSRTPILMLTALAGDRGPGARASRPAPTRTCPSRSICASSARACKALIRAARRERDRNPTTNLPGSRAIDEEIEGALKSGKPTVVVHIDILNFDAYADAIGIARSEDTVREVGGLLLEAGAGARPAAARSSATSAARDFITVLSPEHAEPFIAARRGRVRCAQAPDAARAIPRTSHLVIAIAPTEGLTLNGGADELGRRLGRAMKQAKAAGKTGHVMWSATA